MIKILLLSLFFTFGNIYAQEFFTNEGDVSKNGYFDALGFGIGELLESKRCPTCVEYQSKDVYGTSSSEIVGNVNIEYITYADSKFGLVRIPNSYDMVSLPPYSSIDLIYWSKNTEKGSVDISSLNVFLSRGSVSMGDLTSLIYIDGEYRDISVKYLDYNFLRSGILKEYPGVGIVEASGGVPYGFVLDRVYVKPEIQFVKWEASLNNNVASIKVYVRNISNRLLNNVVYTHNTYSLKRDFQAFEEYIYEYDIEVVNESNLGYAGIFDPNIKQECAVLGLSHSAFALIDSVVLSGVRQSNGLSYSYVGSRTKPGVESFCITRIPYTLYSEEMRLLSEEEEIEVGDIQESVDSDVENISEVLGIEKLPQTGKGNIFFLVVFLILWYYLLRKIYI